MFLKSHDPLHLNYTHIVHDWGRDKQEDSAPGNIITILLGVLQF